MKRAVVVFSGGQDSTTCLAQALHQYDEVHCVTFDYGQRHRAEIDVARDLALKLGARAHKVLDVTLLSELAVSSLTRDNIPVPDYEPDANGIPNTFVPGRNILFLTLAAIYAYQVQAEAVITGVCETDFSGYPDCRDEFVKALNQALKLGMEPIGNRQPKPWLRRLTGFAFGAALISGLSMAVYYGLGWLKPVLGDYALPGISVLLAVAYLGLLKIAASNEPLPSEDPDKPLDELPETRAVLLSGLHFLLPVVVLVWCLMVERLSPGLSAFWGTVMLVIILLTQRPLLNWLRTDGKHDYGSARDGLVDLKEGLVAGARNMIGIGIATATAGIIVGAVSQTGVGLVLADLVEMLSMGNLLLMLFLTALLSLILGMGLPTTANYIVVSSLLAPVVVTLGQQNGLIVPLIAVHLFVFYFGIMADVTPPVGLASFAAAAVSKGDPIKTGITAFYYSLRTAALPFLFIFNTDLLLINVDFAHGVLIFIVATIAMLIFAAATQGFFLVKSRWYESVLLLLVAFTLFRPGFWMDLLHDPYRDTAPAELVQTMGQVEAESTLRLRMEGEDAVGKLRRFTVLLPVPDGASGEDRLTKLGIQTYEQDGKILIDTVTFGSQAADLGLEMDQQILSVKAPTERWPKELMWLPGFLLFGAVVWLQRRRVARP